MPEQHMKASEGGGLVAVAAALVLFQSGIAVDLHCSVIKASYVRQTTRIKSHLGTIAVLIIWSAALLMKSPPSQAPKRQTCKNVVICKCYICVGQDQKYIQEFVPLPDNTPSDAATHEAYFVHSLHALVIPLVGGVASRTSSASGAASVALTTALAVLLNSAATGAAAAAVAGSRSAGGNRRSKAGGGGAADSAGGLAAAARASGNLGAAAGIHRGAGDDIVGHGTVDVDLDARV